jgi:hypothetical protein
MSYNTLEQLRQYGATLKELENCERDVLEAEAQLESAKRGLLFASQQVERLEAQLTGNKAAGDAS